MKLPEKLELQKTRNLLKGLFAAALFCGLIGLDAQEKDEDVFELSPFTVTGDEDSGYMSTRTVSASGTNQSLGNMANSIDVLNRQIIDDLSADSLEELSRYGVTGEYDSNSQNYYFRGMEGRQYEQSSDGVQTYGNAIDTYNIDRLDLSAGPSAMLFGDNSGGGKANVIKSRAVLENDRSRVSLKAGSDGLFRFWSDSNVSVGEKFAARAQLLYDEREFDLDKTFSETKGATFNAAYKFNEKARLDFRIEGRDDDRTDPIGVYRDTSTRAFRMDIDPTANITGGEARRDTEFYSVDLVYTQRIGALNLELRHNRNSNEFDDRLRLRGDNSILVNDLGDVTSNLNWEYFLNRNFIKDWRATLNYKIDSENWGHDLTGNFTYTYEDQENYRERYKPSQTAVNVNDPSTFGFEPGVLDEVFARSNRKYFKVGKFMYTGNFKRRLWYTAGVNYTDVYYRFTHRNTSNFADGTILNTRSGPVEVGVDSPKVKNRLFIPGSVRPQATNAPTYNYGAVYHLNKEENFSLYANYATQFSVLRGLVTDLMDGNADAAPRTGRGTEMGFRFKLWDDKFQGRINRYDTKNTNIPVNISTQAQGQLEAALISVGETTLAEQVASSRRDLRGFDATGWEFTLNVNPSKQWGIRMTTQLNDNSDFESYTISRAMVAPLMDDFIAAGADIDELVEDWDSRPEGEASLGQISESINLLTNYKFTEGALKGVTVGGGVNYRGEVLYQRRGGLDYYAPDFTEAQVFLSYATKMANRKVVYKLDVKNVFDKEAVRARANTGSFLSDRSVSLTASFDL